ncbi:MAG: hemerythrin domain-containing protein [Rhodocyclaceae bacterium]
MNRITEPLQQHHKHCDRDFSAAEERLRQGDWEGGATAFRVLRKDLETHFGVEEDLLFPAFEHHSGQRNGPTRVMCNEHVQMRGLLWQIDDAIAARDADDCLGSLETLLILMQQHNIKEENILYTMCESALAGTDDTLAAEIGAGLALPAP